VKKKIFVRGPVLSQSGYGEQARFALRALRSREDLFDIYIQPINWGQTGWIWDESEFRDWMDARILETQLLIQQKQLQPDMSLQITIPNEFQKICPINIGYTAGIETDRVAPAWLQKGNDMDKILVVSNHAKDTYVNTTANARNQQTGQEFPYKLETPVEVVWENTPLAEEAEAIPGFDLKNDFNFLCISQMGPRKNLENTIKWFVEEFVDQEVGLVIKTNTRGNSRIDLEHTENALKAILAAYPDRKCNVSLLHGDLSESQMRGLYEHDKIKAMVNISHGEGFGLPLFEAARLALPIISVGWSGQTDFLGDKFLKVKHELKPVQPQAVWDGVIQKDSQWAYADQGSFKMALRQMYKKHDEFVGQASHLQKLISADFSDGVLFEGFCNSILGRSKLQPEEVTGVSFCIPTNGKRVEKTKLTINSIKKEMGDFPHEIIMCGDVSSFSSLEGVTLIEDSDSASTAQVAKLRNKAASKSSFNTIAWCDDDIVLGEGWLDKTLLHSKEFGWYVLGNKILNPDGTRHWDRATLQPHKLVSYESPDYHKFIQTAGFFLMRKSIHNSFKWNDESVAFSDKNGGTAEDVDLSLRLNKSKIPISFNKNAHVWHNDENYTQINNLTLNREDVKRATGEDMLSTICDDFENTLETYGSKQ
jgi:glycosyltransferase involved in cell wall biosynthesis